MGMRRTYTAESEQRFWFDIVSAIVLFMTAIGGAWLPKYLCSHGTLINSSKSLAFHLGNMLSAGVMLSAGFCHLLADAHRSLLFLGRFPVSNFLAATGYIITLLADQVVQFVSEQQASQAAKADRSSSGAGGGAGAAALPPPGAVIRNGGYHKLSSGAELTSLAAIDKVVTTPEGALTTAVQREKAGAAAAHDPEVAAPLPAGSVAGGAAANGLAGCTSGAANGRSHNHSHGNGPQDDGDEGDGSGSGRVLNRSQSAGGGDCHSAGVVALLGAGGRRLSFATAVLLAAALCIHSILEGMALGAQSSMRSTEDIMVAIAAHKGLAAYALGASIMESGASSDKFWTVIGCFSLATPLGIFVGYGMSSSSSSGRTGAALSALASGTFLYVAFMEVIPKELADGRHRLAKMAAFLMGYCLMSLLAVWA